jgi:hypothetical protein
VASYLRWGQHFVLMTSNVLKCIGKWRLTSLRRIFTKLPGNVCLISM